MSALTQRTREFEALLRAVGARIVTVETLPPGPGIFDDEVGGPGPWYGIEIPPWLQAAIGHAERLGRDFLLRPLADREARTLAQWQEQGVGAYSAGNWLARPPWQQSVKAARPGGDGGPGRAA